jgi:dienelactone hydrolase
MGNEEQLPRFVRRRISFLAEPGDRVPAFLLIPRGLQGKAPAVLCLHQTTGQGKAEPAGLTGNTNLQYAAELAARGFVTLAPDYPGFGENKFDPYAAGYASATMKGIWNHIRAVDVLSEMPEVDSNRIGVIGHSLGGHNALFVAAFDPRLKAVVSSCGFNSFYAYAGGNLSGWSHRGYMPRISNVYDNDPGQVPFDFPEVLASLAPRPVFVSAPKGDDNFPYTGVVDCLVAARPVYELMGAGRTLVAEHPAIGHEFPSETRAKAYAWLGEILK